MQVGKIKRIPLLGDRDITTGKQVLHHNSIAKIVKILPEAKFNKWDYTIEFLESKVRMCVDMEDLSLLVIEYAELNNTLEGCNLAQISLPEESWKSALQFNLVDTNKEIDFDIIDDKVFLYPIAIKEEKNNCFITNFNKFIDERKELNKMNTVCDLKILAVYEIVRRFVNKYYKT